MYMYIYIYREMWIQLRIKKQITQVVIKRHQCNDMLTFAIFSCVGELAFVVVVGFFNIIK